MNSSYTRYRTGLNIRFLPLLILCVILFLSFMPSSATASLFENRTGHFLSSEAGFVGVEGGLNAGLHRVCETFSYDFAPGSLDASKGARNAPIGYTKPGERFVRVGNKPENLKFTFENPGGTQKGTYAFPEKTFNKIGKNPSKLKDLGDLPGAEPNYYRVLEPPAGTPIQRGTVPGGEFGGRGGVPEVVFPEGF